MSTGDAGEVAKIKLECSHHHFWLNALKGKFPPNNLVH
jgi:hypothetical protein